MSQELRVVDCTYDLILWTRNKVLKFPRHSKYGLGQRLESRLLDLLELLLAAKFTLPESNSCSVSVGLAPTVPQLADYDLRI